MQQYSLFDKLLSLAGLLPSVKAEMRRILGPEGSENRKQFIDKLNAIASRSQVPLTGGNVKVMSKETLDKIVSPSDSSHPPSKDTTFVLADKRGITRKGQTLLTEEHRLLILGQVLNPNAPTVSECSRKIIDRCKAEGLYVPSDATIRRFVKNYTEECFDEWTLWREGKKAWNDKCAISILRDWNLVEVGDVVIADGHVLNFETLDPDTGKGKRMTLLLFYDGASGHARHYHQQHPGA